jgi:hypothetical protein
MENWLVEKLIEDCEKQAEVYPLNKQKFPVDAEYRNDLFHRVWEV